MDAATAALLESWDRQCEILDRLAERIDESVLDLKPSPDGWSIGYHLCHVHEVRYFWLSRVSKEHSERLGDLFEDGENPSRDLDKIREELKKSAREVRSAVDQHIEKGTGEVGGYTHPIMFMQHMIWHEGWHYGLIALALRLGGWELPEEWEEENVWGIWRTE